ncbi:hypothetical protein KP509_21G049000 [Ceratopteris richardii]|uniref:Uncharacterized protein n=1 Tax=Ceratopteris richardii TaxID=49495 RepID=A0A8T2SA55_CERRI|nr:hypothetical protein KP509_21G049000 [Ceratopteris richardii]
MVVLVLFLCKVSLWNVSDFIWLSRDALRYHLDVRIPFHMNGAFIE